MNRTTTNDAIYGAISRNGHPTAFTQRRQTSVMTTFGQPLTVNATAHRPAFNFICTVKSSMTFDGANAVMLHQVAKKLLARVMKQDVTNNMQKSDGDDQ